MRSSIPAQLAGDRLNRLAIVLSAAIEIGGVNPVEKGLACGGEWHGLQPIRAGNALAVTRLFGLAGFGNGDLFAESLARQMIERPVLAAHRGFDPARVAGRVDFSDQLLIVGLGWEGHLRLHSGDGDTLPER